MSPLAPITSSRWPAARAVRYLTRRQLAAAVPAARAHARASLHTPQRSQAFAVLSRLISEQHHRQAAAELW